MSDVAMNALGVETENRMGRSIMSSLHGMWSVGALIGSAAGTVAAHTGTDARLHHLIAALALTAAGLVAVRGVLDLRTDTDGEAPPHFALPPGPRCSSGRSASARSSRRARAWTGPRSTCGTCCTRTAGLAAASTTAFALTMALARLVGDKVVDRFGAVRTVRAGGALATAGGLLVVTVHQPAAALVGFGLIGLGIAVVVPLAFAAAARSGPAPAQAIAGVATITYTSGLIAPSAIGAVADATSLVVSFGLVTLLAFALILGATVLRRRPVAAGASTANQDEPAAIRP